MMEKSPSSADQRKVWLVTGASRGFGAAICDRAIDAGDLVIATGRSRQRLLARYGDSESVLIAELDVTEEAQAHNAVRQGLARFGRIDVLVNNAGFGLLGAIEEVSSQEAQSVFQTNVFGVLNVTRAVLPSMRERRCGHIINMSSMAGYASSSGWGLYAATKFSLEAISESLAVEVGPLGIHTTIVEPGYFRTDFLSAASLLRAGAAIEDYERTVGRTRTFVDGADGQQPGDPIRLAQAIVNLAHGPVPPLRLALGTDSVKCINSKNARVSKNLRKWLEVSRSTDLVSIGGISG